MNYTLFTSLITAAAILLWGISLGSWEKRTPFQEKYYGGNGFEGRIFNILCTITWIIGLIYLCLK